MNAIVGRNRLRRRWRRFGREWWRRGLQRPGLGIVKGNRRRTSEGALLNFTAKLKKKKRLGFLLCSEKRDAGGKKKREEGFWP